MALAVAPVSKFAAYETGGLFSDFPTSLLKIDPNVQGSLSERWADRIAQTWRDEAYGVLEVSYRDGSFFVINGQHRLVAARKLGIRTLRVHVLVNRNTQEEATDWLIGNLAIKGKTATDRFRMQLGAADPDAEAVERICARHGIRLFAKGAGASRSVSTLLRLANKSERLLDETMTVCLAAWPNDPNALGARVVRSVGDFIGLYRGHPLYKQDRLTTALAAFPALAIDQRVRATGMSTGSGGSAGRVVVLDLYNRGLRVNDLPAASQSDMKRVGLGQNPWVGAA